MFQLLKTADLSRQLFDLVVEHVQNLQVLHLRDIRRHRWKTQETNDNLHLSKRFIAFHPKIKKKSQ